MAEQTHGVERDRLEDTLEETIDALKALGLSGVEILWRVASYLRCEAQSGGL